MTIIDDLLRSNEEYADSFDAGALPPEPAKRVVVLTCMDARIHPERALGLEVGDAHVLRNAGGRVTEDVLRSLLLSTHILGTRSLLVVHHTKCGLYGDEAEVKEAVRAAGGNCEEIDFDAFADLDGSVREDIDRLRSSRRVSEDVEVRGFVYEVETGRLREVT